MLNVAHFGYDVYDACHFEQSLANWIPWMTTSGFTQRKKTEMQRRRDRENTKEITIIEGLTSMLFDEARQRHRASLPKSNYNPNDIPILGSYCKNVCRALYLPLSPKKEIWIDVASDYIHPWNEWRGSFAVPQPPISWWSQDVDYHFLSVCPSS